MSEPTRVTYVINSLARGGAERFLCNLALRLDAERFRPEVLCLYERGALADELESAGISVGVVALRPTVGPRNWVQMFRALGDHPGQIVHTHLPDAAWFGLPAAYLRRVPVRISHLQNTYWYWPARLRRLDRLASRFASTSIVCSDAVRSFAQDRLLYPGEKLTVIPNAVETDHFQGTPADRDRARQELGIDREAPLMICVASLTEQKGHRYLLEAMSTVLAELPDARLLLVGKGAEEATLRQMVDERGQSDAVRFLGERDDVPQLMVASDVFVLPSLWEGFGLVFVEAAAAGVPVVATTVGGVPEVVEDGETGLLVPPRDPDRLAEALLSVLRDRGLAQAMGSAARERARARFDVGAVARKVERLYLDLLSAK